MRGALAVVLCAVVASAAAAGTFQPGNIVVTQIGNGTETMGSFAMSTRLLEFTPGGTLVQTLDMPTVGGGANRKYANIGNATVEGYLSRSADGRYLTLGGYDVAVGTSSSSFVFDPVNYNRVIGRVGWDGNIDTTTTIDNLFTTNIRSVTSADGTGFWASGTPGVTYSTYGSSSTGLVSNTVTNSNNLGIFNDQLYVSCQAGTRRGPCTVGTGLPTTSGQTMTSLPGFPTATMTCFDYFFSDDSTVYVTDGSSTRPGLKKYTFDGSTWSLAYELKQNFTKGLRGLTGTVVGDDVILYAIDAGAGSSDPTSLWTVTDNGPTSPYTLLATSPANTAFRGVAFAPVPEPASIALLLLGGLLIRRRS